MSANESFEIKPDELATQANALDCLFWDSIWQEQEIARVAFPDRPGAVVGNDLFNTLFHYDPKIREDGGQAVRGKALKQLMESSAWMQMHTNTMGDGDLAGAATVALRARLKESPEGDKLMQALEMAEQQKEKLEALEELAGTMKREQVAAEKARIEELNGKAEAAVEQIMSDRAAVRAIREAVKDTAENVQNAIQLARGWGQEAGTVQEFVLDPEMACLLAGDKIRRIMALAGKMREVISAERAKRPKMGPQKVSLEVGADLYRVVPAELAMLGDPELEPFFDRKLVEHNLVLTKREEKPKLGKGPFVVCLDESSSMKGTREEWAKALALAMAQQAHTEKRHFGAVAFSSKHQVRTILKPEPAEFLKWASSFYNGGTDFDTPLLEARKMLGELPDADIIFISDGECESSAPVLEELTRAKGALGVRVLGIQIGGGDPASLQAFSDVTFTLKAERGTAGLEAVIQEIK